MNQRFRELALQAGMVKILNEHAHEYGNGQFENTEYPELEKFAELIVKACVEDCRDMFMVGSVSWNLLNEKLDHFGVEE